MTKPIVYKIGLFVDIYKQRWIEEQYNPPTPSIMTLKGNTHHVY